MKPIENPQTAARSGDTTCDQVVRKYQRKTTQKSCTPQPKHNVLHIGGGRLRRYIDPVTQAETAAALSAYLHQLQLGDLHPTTLAKYRQCLSVYQEWLGGDPITTESAKQFFNHLRQLGYQSATVRSYYHAIRPFLSALGIPLQARFRHQRQLPAYHGPDQVQAILDSIRNRTGKWSQLIERDTIIVLILAYTGIRRNELLALRLRDINFHNRMIKVRGKGYKERVIPMSDALYQPLREYTRPLQPGDYLFSLQPKRIWSIVTGYAAAAGIDDLHPHSFRHYFATQLVESSVSLKIVQELLGHADISTTAIYLDVVPHHLTDAVSKLPGLTIVSQAKHPVNKKNKGGKSNG